MEPALGTRDKAGHTLSTQKVTPVGKDGLEKESPFPGIPGGFVPLASSAPRLYTAALIG